MLNYETLKTRPITPALPRRATCLLYGTITHPRLLIGKAWQCKSTKKNFYVAVCRSVCCQLPLPFVLWLGGF
jgi:hypothetical protein